MGTVELQGLSHNRTIEVELLIAVLAVNLGSCNLTKPVIVWITGDDLISNEPGIDMGNFIADNNLLRDEDRLLELIKAIVDGTFYPVSLKDNIQDGVDEKMSTSLKNIIYEYMLSDCKRICA